MLDSRPERAHVPHRLRLLDHLKLFGQMALMRGRLATGARAAMFRATPQRYYDESWRTMIGGGVDLVGSLGSSGS